MEGVGVEGFGGVTGGLEKSWHGGVIFEVGTDAACVALMAAMTCGSTEQGTMQGREASIPVLVPVPRSSKPSSDTPTRGRRPITGSARPDTRRFYSYLSITSQFSAAITLPFYLDVHTSA